MSGIGTIKGITFQTVQALSDVVDLVVEGHGEAVTIEGADDVVDYEVLDRDGRPVAVEHRAQRIQYKKATHRTNSIGKPNDIHCYCTRAMHQAIWEAALGKKPQIDILQTVRRGDPTCHFLVHMA